MTDHRDRMTTDMTRKLCEKLEEVSNRELRIAAAVLPPPELAIMLVQAARATVLGTLAFAIERSNPDTDPGAFFDVLADGIDRAVRAAKPEILSVVEAKRAEAAQ